MNLIKGSIVLAAMLVTSAMAYVLTPVSAAVRDPTRLQHAIPHQFGRWRQEADRLVQVDVGVRDQGNATEDPEQLYDEVLMRTYRRDDGMQVMLALAYGRLQRQEIKIHRPDLCYYGQGFDVRRLPDHLMPLTSMFTVNVQTMLAQKPRRTELVSYWIRIGDRITSSAWETRWTLFREGIRGVIPDGILVRVSSLVSADDQMTHARDAQQDFLSSLYQTLPPPDQRLIAGKGASL